METKLYNLDTLKMTTEDDNDFLVIILTTFLNNNREMVSRLEQAYTSKNLTEVGEIAHKMLGSYKHLEINSLLAPLTELETLVLGNKLENEKIKENVDRIKNDSEKVFKELEKEISEINSAN